MGSARVCLCVCVCVCVCVCAHWPTPCGCALCVPPGTDCGIVCGCANILLPMLFMRVQALQTMKLMFTN